MFLILSVNFFASYAFAQVGDLTKTVLDQIVRPAGHEINIAFDKANPSVRCEIRYVSIKFIVDSKTFVCDTVMFSKSIAGKIELDPVVFKNFKIDWKNILDTSICNHVKRYEVIQPISFFMGECFNKYPKLRDDQIWEAYTDLMMLDISGKANVVILQPSSFSVHK